MRALLGKAKSVFIALLAAYLASFFTGYAAGRLEYVTYEGLADEGIFRLSRNLEQKIPGYGRILRSYKACHDRLKRSFVSKKDFLSMGVLIFLNNFVVANITTILRALFVIPILLTICGKFLQGVGFAQKPVTPLMWLIFVAEFGGYFLTTGAALAGVLWTLFNERCGFTTRREAIVSGVRLLGCMYLISGIGILVGSICETLFLRNMLALLA